MPVQYTRPGSLSLSDAVSSCVSPAVCAISQGGGTRGPVSAHDGAVLLNALPPDNTDDDCTSTFNKHNTAPPHDCVHISITVCL